MFSLYTHLKNGMLYIRQHPELFMTVVLVIVIPISFLVSGQQFLDAARSNQERLELDRIGIMHDLFVTFAEEVHFDGGRIEEEMRVLASQNPDITKMRIIRDEGSELRVIASLESNEIQTLVSEPDAYRYGYGNPNETFITAHAREGIRYWQSLKRIESDNDTTYYLFIETSLEHIDSLLSKHIRRAYYWLFGLLLVITYLLIRHVRLIDYSYLYRETKKANEIKDLFTNMIAHELRAPLTAMRGYASMIRERVGVDEVTQKNAVEIESAAGRLLTIVNDLLDVARIQSGKLHVERTEVHLSGIVHSVVEALHPSADEKRIRLNIDDVNGTIKFMSDEKRLFQVLTNILSNAIKYTKEGVVTVALIETQDRVEIRVKDTGMGISADDQKKMFAPFFRANEKNTTTITGTGLGLWVTKQLVELMGGSIGVESIKDVGTHVVLTFPK